MRRKILVRKIDWKNISILILAALLINIAFSKMALAFELPFFLDSIGTVLAAMLGGIFPSVIVGFCSNVINGISSPATLYYGVISILIAGAATLFQRNGFFRSIPKAILAVLVFALLGGGLGSVLTYFLYGYDFGNGISAPISIAIYNSLNLSVFSSQLLADIAIDIFDKVIVVTLSIFVFTVIPASYKRVCANVFLFYPKKETPEYEKEIKRSLLRKIVVMVIVAEILLGFFATATGSALYRKAALEKFTDITNSVVKAALAVIDGDKVEEYLANGRNASGYTEREKMLYQIKNSFPNTKYLYVYQFREDGVYVVFDLESEGGVKADQPGDVVEFDPGFAPQRDKLLRGEEVEPIVSDDEYGWLMTILRSVKDSSGKTVAYVAADTLYEELVEDQAKFIIKLISMFFGISIVIMTIVLEFVNRGIINHVNNMASASMLFAHNLDKGDTSGIEMLKSLDIHTFDEIEYLYKAILKMGSDSLKFIDEVIRQSMRITKMQEEIIANFAEMVEARDLSTGDHIKKTAGYVEAIANELLKEGRFKDELTVEYIKRLRRSAPLHDIGKIAVSDLILNKNGRFTEEEFAIMKSHAEKGKDILAKIEANASDMDPNYMKEAKEMALYHHEKWDGSGYPTGIKGEAIPLSARIMAVADVFDALVAERVYKKSFPYEKAMSIIMEGSGKAFDPDIVEAFSHISQRLYDERTKLNQEENNCSDA